MSLRTRILVLTVGATVAVLVLFSIPLYVLEHRSASHDVEQTEVEAARGVADYVSAGGAGADLEAYVDRVNSRDDTVSVAVRLSDGTTYGPDLPGSSRQVRPPAGSDPDHDHDHDQRFLPISAVDVDQVGGGQLVSVGVTTSSGPVLVMAFAGSGQVTSTVSARLLPLAIAGLLLLVLAAGAAELVARRLVRDLDRTAELADTIAGGDAVARVPESGPPEVRRVAHALNGLAGRIDELLAAERETVADLSHRLRTPLTVLRLDVEALPAGDLADELEQHLDQLERTLTAVIRQARRSQREGTLPSSLPGPVVTEAADFWRPLVEDQGRRLDVSVAPDLPAVHCAADDLRAAVDALVENCVAHTPDGTPIAVSARRGPDGGTVVVEVRDRGPGFDGDSVHRGRSDRGSTGLGLDIARGCARASGGGLEVTRESDQDGTWTVVRLELGPALGPPSGTHSPI